MLRGSTLLGLLCLAACNRSASGEAAGTMTGVTSVSPPGDTSSESTGSSSSTSTGSTTTGDVSTSTGASTGSTDGVPVPGDMPEFTTGEPAGCKGKIDFLFVISRGSNMQDAQARLLDSFPGFIAAIQELGADYAASDFHIMVVDGDEGWGTYACNQDCTPEGCPVPDYPCDLLQLTDDCEFTRGAGTIFNAGTNAPNEPCGLPALHRFVDGDNPALLELFTCMATVGTNGGGALGDGLAAAVSPALREGCNQGFLRDDALLFVTFIGGSDSNFDPPPPEEWAQAVFDAKNGDKHAIVMLGIHPFDDLETCIEDDEGSLCRMLALFPHRLFEWVGVSDFAPAFEEAVGLIDEACAELVPQ